ncbi:MAG TPA: DNA-binding protein [Acidobacteria bacterium]|nr:DNA-binding protein [Acidobacteriota bacterium]
MGQVRALVPAEVVESVIVVVRGEKVLLDRDIARLYEVETRTLMQAVKRNKERFPKDFMLQLTVEEAADLRCQIGTSSWGGRRYRPYAFTEQGVAMLSGVLRSERAVRVNVEIMRAFVRLRRLAASREDLAQKIEDLEEKYDSQFSVVFDALRELMAAPDPADRPIGFE